MIPGCAPRYLGSASKVPSVSRTACNNSVVITGTLASQSELRSCVSVVSRPQLLFWTNCDRWTKWVAAFVPGCLVRVSACSIATKRALQTACSGLSSFLYSETGRRPGPFSFRKELANQAENELKG